MSATLSATLGPSSVTENSLDGDWSEVGVEDEIQIKAPKIHGRSREQDMLRIAYEELSQRKTNKQIVLLHGCSGAGKTALVEQFRDMVCETKNAHFCAGKYFQHSGVQEPYSAIMAAFSDLCDLVSQADDFNKDRLIQIRSQLGPETGILKELISNVSFFLDPTRNLIDTAMDDLTDESALYKFKVACKSFLNAMSIGQHPIVIFLDDIQWMDKGSQYLVEMYLNDAELRNVMFILAYRDEEKGVVTKMLANVNKKGFLDVPLESLKSDEVTALLSSLMKAPVTEKMRRLGALVQKRSEGNIYHVLQFMEAIERDDLLLFDSNLGSWVYCVEEIQREVMASNSLTDLLLRRIQLLPQGEQETLKIASLLGYEFQAEIVFKVARTIKKEAEQEDACTSLTAASSLVKAVKLGVVEIINDGKSFNFTHDKLQSAFHSMLSAHEEQKLQRVIGEAFLSSSAMDRKYHAAVHLNKTVDAKYDPEFRLHLARLNLEAAWYCKSRSAFDDAASLLRDGLLLLEGEGKWSSNFDLSFEMTERLARMELSIGNLDECKLLTKETLHRAKSRDMKIKSLLIDVECLMAGNEMTSVITTASSALSTLGFHQPKKISTRHVLSKYLSVRKKLHRKTDSDILELPTITNCVIEAATRILTDVGFYCFLQDEQIPGIYSFLCAAELTLLHGLSPHSATALVFYGMVELTLGNYDRAYRFGKVAIKMIDKVKCRDTEGVAISVWICTLGHWEEPIGNLRQRNVDAVNICFEKGDTFYTALAVGLSFGMGFFLGHNLCDLEVFMRHSYYQLLDLSKEAMLLWVQPALQTVLNLRSTTLQGSKIAILSGEIMHETDYFRKVSEANHPILEVVAGTYKGMLAQAVGCIDLSINMYESMKGMGKAYRNNYGFFLLAFGASIAYYEQYRRHGKRHHLKLARKWKVELEYVKARGNPNVNTHVALLCAEEMSTRKSATIDSVCSAYELSIANTTQRHLQLESLANRRAAFFMVDRGMYDKAEIYFKRSISHLEEWGAPSLAGWLETEYEKIFRTQIQRTVAVEECAELIGEQINVFL